LAEIRFIYQGFKHDEHAISLNNLLLRNDIEQVIFNVAYVRTSGVFLLHEGLKKIKNKVSIYAGIRNGITSIQAVF
jgi:HKD family nuclease